jgi:hypothetical protein
MDVHRQIPTAAGLVIELKDGPTLRWEGDGQWSRESNGSWMSENGALVPAAALHAAAVYVSQSENR